MRDNDTVQFVFEDTVRSDRFIALTRHTPSRLDLHLTLAPCQGNPDDLIIRASDTLTNALDTAERRHSRQDCVVHDIERIGGNRH